MDTLRTWLQGKKTYVVGVGAIVATIVAWSQGTLDNAQAVQAVVAALMGMFLRAGVDNAVAKVADAKRIEDRLNE